MRSTRRMFALVFVAAAALVIVGAGIAATTCFGVKKTTTLTGGVEVPIAGDPDGTGKAVIGLNVAEGLVCWSMTVRGIGTAAAAHIHKGATGVSGPVVVPLGTPSTGATKGCTAAGRALIRDIVRNPSEYYVNVHNKDYPAGALRGQLP